MKQIFVIISWIVILLSSCSVYANNSRGSMAVSVTVTCNCNVNGIIVPINEGACVPTCDALKKSNNTSNVMITQNGDTKVVTY